MRIAGFFMMLLLARLSPALAQHGSAENGYYPLAFSGDTWTGVVTATNDATREITLSFTKGDKTETFTGVVEQGYKVKMADGTMRELKVGEIPAGARLKVYYMARQKKDGDKKVKYYEIFRILFLSLPGEPAAPEKSKKN
ncbi:MAG: hypothetical protein HYR59_03430 [Acidobacteria bacterium]|nr:hypothetical protein [Acidobacteriota bacterium]